MTKLVTDKYTFTVGTCADIDPDAFDGVTDMLAYAIQLAEEHARIYAMPCVWTAHTCCGRVVVTRKRHATRHEDEHTDRIVAGLDSITPAQAEHVALDLARPN